MIDKILLKVSRPKHISVKDEILDKAFEDTENTWVGMIVLDEKGEPDEIIHSLTLAPNKRNIDFINFGHIKTLLEMSGFEVRRYGDCEEGEDNCERESLGRGATKKTNMCPTKKMMDLTNLSDMR